MASKGYVLNGVYHKYVGKSEDPAVKLNKVRQGMFQQSDHARQRFDHAAEIIQPYTVDGKPNPAFIEVWPDAAAEYGFIPKTEVEQPRESDTPGPGQAGYGGSTPWGWRNGG